MTPASHVSRRMIGSRIGRSALSLSLVWVALVSSADPHDSSSHIYGHVSSSDVYGEVSVNLDPETEKVGGALYMQLCSHCHDGEISRAPQRYTLEQGTPETVLASLLTGPMREVASGLSVAQKTAIAEFITRRKIEQGDVRDAGVRCTGERQQFDLDQGPVFSHWGFEPDGSHYIKPDIAGVRRDKLASTKLEWAFAYPAATRARSQPAVGGGALFVGSQSGLVYAFDLETGCTRWQFMASAEVRNAMTLSPWDSQDADPDPLLYFGDLSGNQYAISALTGALRWRQRMDAHGSATLTGAAELSSGVLYVPVSSLEEGAAIAAGYPCCTFRGSVVALDARSGQELWRRHFIPKATQTGINEVGTPQYGPSGVPVWAGMALDNDRLYIATGDDYSGDGSPTSDAIIALDKFSGETIWVQQARFGDVWNGSCEDADRINCPEDSGPDWDYGAGPVVTSDATGRRVVLAGDKGGVVAALDAATGAPLWKTKVGRGGVVAGINFGIAAHGGKVFVPVSDVPDGRTYDEPAKPGLYALDVTSGEYIWRAPAVRDLCLGRPGCYPGYSAAISVTDEYVLAGANDGWLRAFDADDGSLLWEFDTTETVIAVDGRAAKGGSIGGGQAPLVVGDRIILNSGYAFAGKMPGNALLVLRAEAPSALRK